MTGATLEAAKTRASPRLRRRIERTLLYAVLVVGSLVYLFPLYWTLRTSLLPEGMVLAEPPVWIPWPPQWVNYATMWEAGPFPSWIRNSAADGGRHWTHAVVTEDEARDFLRQRTTLSNGRQLYFEPKIVRVDNLDLRPYPGNVTGWLGAFGPIKVVYRLGDLPEEHRHVRMFTREPGSPDWQEGRATMDPDILVPAFTERVPEEGAPAPRRYHVPKLADGFVEQILDDGQPELTHAVVATRMRRLFQHVGDDRLPVVGVVAHYGSAWAKPEDFDDARRRRDTVVRVNIPTPTPPRLNNQSLEPILELRDGSLLVASRANRLPRAKHAETGIPVQYPEMYRSSDGGRTWMHLGSIPYARLGDLVIARAHVTPDLPAGNWLAVLRSARGHAIGAAETDAPLLATRSYDQGVSWSEPEVIRPSSTNPIGGLLPNGVVARLYGRPGQFITFCGDGEGKSWGNDVTLVEADSDRETTCCNPEWLVTGPDRFLVAYSDYRYVDPLGQIRKAVLVREVVVTR